MKMDEHNEVINHPDTYDAIVEWLRVQKSILIGWTDQQGSHFDVLFNLSPDGQGNIQRGLHNSRYFLFVSVIGKGTFGFKIFDRAGDLFPSYVAEKLSLSENVTTEELTTLLNEVITRLGNVREPEDYVEKCMSYEIPFFFESKEDMPCDSCGVVRSKHD